MLQFICYPKCSTCKKAQDFLDGRGVKYELRDIKEKNPSYDELKAWHEAGIPLKKLFNTSGLLYRSLKLKEKLPNMSDEEQLRLLAGDGMLVKRPIAVFGKTVLVGFDADKWAELK